LRASGRDLQTSALKLLKKLLFQKDFPPTTVAQKHGAISRHEKMAFSTPVGLPWDSLPPPPEFVLTHRRTLMLEPKFLALIGYLTLPRVLRSAAFGHKGAQLRIKTFTASTNFTRTFKSTEMLMNIKLSSNFLPKEYCFSF